MITRSEITDVAVIGAGIGGLSAVLALRAAGVDAHAYERAPAIAPLGAALIVRVQGLDLIRQWVDTAGYDANRVVVDAMEFRGHDGTLLRTTPLLGEPGDPGWGHVVHRADLFDALRGGVPDAALHLGREARSVDDRGDHVEIAFTDGSTVRARAVVGADGIRSLVRRTVISEDEPVFAGMVNCRSVVPAEVLGDLPNDRIRGWMQDSRVFATFPVRGGREVCYDAVVFDAVEGEESWTNIVDAETVLAKYADFDPLVGRIVRSGTNPIVAFSTYDREPIDRWTAGRVTLLGDAAHPMLPSRGQGANQAIQDAAALVEALAPALRASGDIHAALTAYEAVRRPPTAHFQTTSRTLPADVRP